MNIPISEITVFHKDGEIQKLTGTYVVHDAYIEVRMQDDHNKRLWHDIVIPMHTIIGFEAHERPKRLYMVES
jgi:hypothetical protein